MGSDDEEDHTQQSIHLSDEQMFENNNDGIEQEEKEVIIQVSGTI